MLEYGGAAAAVFEDACPVAAFFVPARNPSRQCAVYFCILAGGAGSHVPGDVLGAGGDPGRDWRNGAEGVGDGKGGAGNGKE